jgi:pSer/pThr/pTyr-binding forkhead associated (FHA) protein
MFLKIEFDSQDAVTYKLSKTDILIGSSPSCQIVINDETISKKHAKLIEDNHEWFVLDQGSTNGTFVDDEQLVPGKRIKLTHEQTVRLGSKVFVVLTDDGANAIDLPNGGETSAPLKSSAQASISSEQDRTKVISLDDLKQAKALADKKKAREFAAKKASLAKQKRLEAERKFKIIIVSAVILISGYHLNRRWQREKLVSNKETVIKKLKGQHKAKEDITLDVEGSRIGRNSLLARNKIIDLLRGPKCKSIDVKPFCELKILTYGDSGVVQDVNKNVVFFLEETEQLKMAKNYLPMDSALDYDSLQKVAFLFFMKDLFSEKELDQGKHYYLALYRIDTQRISQPSSVFGVTGSSAQLLLEDMKNFQFNQPDAKVKEFVHKCDEFFTTY